jgi:hypothetical protein
VWLALAGGVGGAWIVAPWLDLRLTLEATAPIVRPRFVLAGVGPVHQPGVAGRAGLALELRF